MLILKHSAGRLKTPAGGTASFYKILYQFQKRFGKEVLLIKSQYGIKEAEKQKKIEKIDVSKKNKT